nr:hypothetical protein CFP56_19656 [Quercus suber]
MARIGARRLLGHHDDIGMCWCRRRGGGAGVAGGITRQSQAGLKQGSLDTNCDGEGRPARLDPHLISGDLWERYHQHSSSTRASPAIAGSVSSRPAQSLVYATPKSYPMIDIGLRPGSLSTQQASENLQKGLQWSDGNTDSWMVPRASMRYSAVAAI